MERLVDLTCKNATISIGGVKYHNVDMIEVRENNGVNLVMINGVPAQSSTTNIIIKVDGDVENINLSSGRVECQKAKNISTTSANVYCNDVSGNVNTMSGDIDCNNINGSVTTASGDIDCNNVGGSVQTRSGNIKKN